MQDVCHFSRADGVRLAYRHRPGTGPAVAFLPGYMSDMTGSKAAALDSWAAARGRAYLRLDYSGCGASGGDFGNGCISRWVADVAELLDHLGIVRPLLAGSSMGGWIALRLALARPVAALVGIAAAPDFTDWGLKISKADCAALDRDGYLERPSSYGADTIPLHPHAARRRAR